MGNELSLALTEQFKKAGWSQGRNVQEDYKNVKNIDSIPTFLKDFLFQYGNLVLNELNVEDSAIENQLEILPEHAEFEEAGDYTHFEELIGKKVYPFGFLWPDFFMVACDDDGAVYFLAGADGTMRFSTSFLDGIEKFIHDDWDECLSLNEETKEWYDPSLDL